MGTSRIGLATTPLRNDRRLPGCLLCMDASLEEKEDILFFNAGG
jgi:hypothetical protein